MGNTLDRQNWRIIRINGHGIIVDNDYQPTRRNYSCQSKQFETILKESGINMTDTSQFYRFQKLVQETKLETLSDIQYRFTSFG